MKATGKWKESFRDHTRYLICGVFLANDHKFKSQASYWLKVSSASKPTNQVNEL